jgi:ATP-dependent DNA ligase
MKKWDGVCVIGYVQDGTTRLMSRNDLDVSVSYPEVLDAPDRSGNVRCGSGQPPLRPP